MQNLISLGNYTQNVEEQSSTPSNVITQDKVREFSKAMENPVSNNSSRQESNSNTSTSNSKSKNDTSKVNITSDNEVIKNNVVSNSTDTNTVENIQVQEAVSTIRQTVENIDTLNVASNEVVLDIINQINQLLETATNGQLDPAIASELSAILEQLNIQIENSQIAVSENTQNLLAQLSDRLVSQNPKDLEAKELNKLIDQIAQDLNGNNMKTEAEAKKESEMSDADKALTLEVKEKNNNPMVQNNNASDVVGETQTSVMASEAVEESQMIKNTNSDTEISQKVVDDMELTVEEIMQSSADSNSNNQNFTSASDTVVKLAIENTADAETLPAFTLDKAAQNTSTLKATNINMAVKEMNSSDVLNQIGSKMDQLKDGSQTRIVLNLRPQELGRVTIELVQGNGGLTTNIIAQNPQVKELLDKSMDTLKQQLVAQGVNVQGMQVKTVEQNAQSNLADNNSSNKDNTNSDNQENSTKQNNNNQEFNGRRAFVADNQGHIDEAEGISNEANNTMAQINTMGGKISYNL